MIAALLTPVVAAYGAGSPLLWWSVTAAGVVLLIVSVFLLREPAVPPSDGPADSSPAADGEASQAAGPGAAGPEGPSASDQS